MEPYHCTLHPRPLTNVSFCPPCPPLLPLVYLLSLVYNVHVFVCVSEPLSTVGVDLGIWKYRKDLEPEYLKSKKKGSKQLRTVTFYTWDFGGQVGLCAYRMDFVYNQFLKICSNSRELVYAETSGL